MHKAITSKEIMEFGFVLFITIAVAGVLANYFAKPVAQSLVDTVKETNTHAIR